MRYELFERVRSRIVRYDPRDGDVLALHVKDLPYDFHIKVIKAYIKSDVLFVDGASLIYIYVPHKNGGFIVHDRLSFYGVAAYHFDQMLPCEFEFIGCEPVFRWERSIDLGFTRWGETVEITEYERELYSADHDIITSDEGKLVAVPFFDAFNERIDHVPRMKLNGEGYATLRGVLSSAEEWLRKNEII